MKRIINFISRRIKRIYEKNYFYKQSLNNLSKLYNKNKKNIWFIGSAHYDNIGDLAISEATVKFIHKNCPSLNLIEVRLCDYYKYYKALKKFIHHEDIIIMQGGGNMGFLYFDAEVNRRDVIKHFPKNKIIIFPSTIDYGTSLREKFELHNSIKIYNRHQNLIVCARETTSYNKMKKIYKNVILVPDIVLSLEHIDISQKRNKIIACLRKDQETTNKALKLQQFLKNRNDCIFIDNISEEKNVDIELRSKIFINKLNELANAKVVITDRLHIMIFCVLINIHCLFIDNSNKKISSVYETWIKNKKNYIKKLDTDQDIEKQINEIYKINIKENYDFKKDFNILLKHLK